MLINIVMNIILLLLLININCSEKTRVASGDQAIGLTFIDNFTLKEKNTLLEILIHWTKMEI